MEHLDTPDILRASQQMNIILEALGISIVQVGLLARPSNQCSVNPTLPLGAGDVDLLISPASCDGLDIRCVGLDDLDKLFDPGLESILIFVGVGRWKEDAEDLCSATEFERIGRWVRIKVDVLDGRCTSDKTENSFHEWRIDANRESLGQSHILSLH